VEVKRKKQMCMIYPKKGVEIPETVQWISAVYYEKIF